MILNILKDDLEQLAYLHQEFDDKKRPINLESLQNYFYLTKNIGWIFGYYISPNTIIEIIKGASGGTLVGTATLLKIPTMLHGGGFFGQIENVVVSPQHREKGIGKELIETCIKYAKQNNFYKIVINCSDNNIPFYEKCGFYWNYNQMRYDL